MKMFVFRHGTFCWVCAVVANTVEEAIELANKAGHMVDGRCAQPDPYPDDPDTGYTVEEIRVGLIVEGGGNG